jgi:hypothetical protein
MRTALATLLLLATPALAFDAVPRQPGKVGLGIGGGTRTSGLSIKHTLDKSFSVQGVVGVDPARWGDRGGTLAISADALFEMPALYTSSDIEIAWAIGAGPYLAVGDNFWLGASGVLGLEFNLQPIPLEFTIEYRPTIELVGPRPDSQSRIYLFGVGGHLRWWF